MNIFFNLPNFFTLLRILLIPVLIIIFYLPFHWVNMTTAIIFTIASFTDWLDGYLARKLGQLSYFGAFLDPVADKLLVATSLLLLVSANEIHYITLPAIIIVGREIVISALREWMAEIGRRASVAVNYIAKVKTGMQMLAIILLLASSSASSGWKILGCIFLYLSSILTIWSMITYIKIAWPDLIKKN